MSPSNKRKSLLIYPSVQKRIIGIFLFGGSVGFFGLATGAVIFSQKILHVVESSGALQAPEKQLDISDLWLQFTFFLITFGILYVIALSLLGLFFSHRLVGGLMRISKDLSEMIRDNNFKAIKIRERDYLEAIVTQINDSIAQHKQNGHERKND